jgi:hypothetical protein
MSLLPLDGPSAQATLSVDASTVVEAKAGGSALTERKVVTLQPLTGKVYVYFGGDGAAPNAATVIANGLVCFKNAKETYEASPTQKIYLLSVTGTVNVIVAERS